MGVFDVCVADAQITLVFRLPWLPTDLALTPSPPLLGFRLHDVRGRRLRAIGRRLLRLRQLLLERFEPRPQFLNEFEELGTARALGIGSWLRHT